MPDQLTSYRPQSRNANRHTARGLGALEKSIQADGWIGAITVAADGETFDGSARIETGAAAGFDDAIVVHSDGSKPIVHVRTDIPNADDPRAKRLGVAANRVAQLDYDPDPALLAALAQEVDLSGLYYDDELQALLASVAVEPGAGGDDFDTTPQDGPTRTQAGDLWAIGPHRLLVGDCTDAANVARLMDGERAALCLTDPPYNVGRQYTATTDDSRLDYEQWSRDWFALAMEHAVNVAFSCGHPNVPMWAGILAWKWIICWYKPGAMLGSPFGFSNWEPVLFYGTTKPRGTDVINVPIVVTEELEGHPVPKQTDFGIKLLELLSDRRDLIYDPFLGSGTTIVAAHRTGRRCYGCEIEPRYADVILRRAEAEGLSCSRLD